MPRALLTMKEAAEHQGCGIAEDDVPDWEVAGYLGMSAEVFRKTYAHHSPSAQRRAADAR